jgi:hypothetical protein
MICDAITSSSAMALQSNTDLRLLNGLLPVSSVSDLFPAFNFSFINICCHTAILSVIWATASYILYFFLLKLTATQLNNTPPLILREGSLPCNTTAQNRSVSTARLIQQTSKNPIPLKSILATPCHLRVRMSCQQLLPS